MRLYSTMQVSSAISLTLNSMEKSGATSEEIELAEKIFTNFYRQQLLTLIPSAEN